MPITTCPVCQERIVVLRPVPYPVRQIRCPTCRVRLEVTSDRPFAVDVLAPDDRETTSETRGSWAART